MKENINEAYKKRKKKESHTFDASKYFIKQGDRRSNY
jgi:hypothetical protein